MMDEEFFLTKPGREHFPQLKEFREEFIQNGDSMDGCGPLRKYDNLEEYISAVESFKSRETLPEGKVVTTQFVYVRKSDNRVVGMIQVRHYFNEYVAKFGGNIGYSVRPSERRKGYATRMLHDILPFCKSIGLDKVLVNCIEGNEGSKRTILNNGGVYESTVYEQDKDRRIERYWIKTD